MKLALLCDTHLGARNDSKIFLEHQADFFTNIFFPALEEHRVDTVLHLGDVFDRRKHINFYTLERSREFFFDRLSIMGINMHIIIGNHDTYFTNTNKINSVALLLNEYENISVYEKDPVELEFGSTKIMMCPWLAKDNYQQALETVGKSSANILMGHFTLKGFEMMKGVVSDHGLDYKQFDQFESVYSGHFHHPSKYGNVRYLGAQYEMNWSDYGSNRGFYFLDTETRELEYIENNKKIHHKLEYDDTDLTLDEVAGLDTSMMEGCFIKVMVKNRTNNYLYDMFLEKLNESGAADVKTIEDTLNLSEVGDDSLVEDIKDTKDILHTYIDSVDTKIDKKEIKHVVDDLYQEAINL